MKPACLLIVLILCLFVASPVLAAENPMAKLLPAPSCANGWVMDGTVNLYNKDTLFERINGESELYFPYGFDTLASARYAHPKDPQIAMEADVYRMGSLLDAFGMFANYRRADEPEIAIGGGGTISASQLFFYQGRYLVRLQASGPANPGAEVFQACARAIGRNLPPNPGQPKELGAFDIPGVEKRSERYIASSLLGYDFFRHGLMADVVLNNQTSQLFLVNEDSPETARTAFDRYRVYLKASGIEPSVRETAGLRLLTAVDPLYGPVVVEQSGRFVMGVVRVGDTAAAQQLLEQVRKRAAGR